MTLHQSHPQASAALSLAAIFRQCEAIVSLSFTPGRAGMAPALDNLKQSASADVKPTGLFDKPTA